MVESCASRKNMLFEGNAIPRNACLLASLATYYIQFKSPVLQFHSNIQSTNWTIQRTYYSYTWRRRKRTVLKCIALWRLMPPFWIQRFNPDDNPDEQAYYDAIIQQLSVIGNSRTLDDLDWSWVYDISILDGGLINKVLHIEVPGGAMLYFDYGFGNILRYLRWKNRHDTLQVPSIDRTRLCHSVCITIHRTCGFFVCRGKELEGMYARYVYFVADSLFIPDRKTSFGIGRQHET